MKTLEIMKQIEEKAKELNKNDIRILNDETMPIGKGFRHGDVYLHRVSINHPVGKELDRRQIADGASLGARHILKGSVKVYEGVQLPWYVNNGYPLGYAFDVMEEGAILTHPEHAHADICHKGLARYQVTHQMDMRTLQRVSD